MHLVYLEGLVVDKWLLVVLFGVVAGLDETGILGDLLVAMDAGWVVVSGVDELCLVG